MLKQLLHNNWILTNAGGSIKVPAQVPGCVHTDLIRAGKIPDPYRDFNEMQLRWIGETDWEYHCTFDADAQLFSHERIDLVCDGLDTVAKIFLNDELVAETFNMHRGYRFDVRKHLKRGRNTLAIIFSSPVKYAETMRDKLGARPYCNGPGGPFNFIRKMACNFGWDWGPALPTCGIWRGIRLEGWSIARIADVRPVFRHPTADDFPPSVDGPAKGVNPYTGKQWTPDDSLRFLDLHLRFEVTDAGRFRRPHHSRDNVAAELQIGFIGPDGDVVANPRIYGPLVDGLETLSIPVPKLWNPAGHGEQALYKLELTLISWGPDSKHPWLTRILSPKESLPRTYGNSAERIAGKLLDTCSSRVGLRTVELDTSPDDIGSKFVIKVNNKPIFCKGFNWIPDDCFLDRACDPARVRQRIQQAVAAGANMLRVWGGGIFETDDFYNICDEMGVMVWQDFLFACAMYPEEEPFRTEVEEEARYNVARLAHHPSLTIWNGCNENIWAYREWGWKDDANVQKLSWGKGYYFDLLPKICKELTPTIPYWAGSPWSGDYDVDNGIPPNADTHGNMHVWKPWFHEDYASYRNFNARFCSEFGFQGPATYSSIASVVPENARDFGSPEMRHRQKSGDRVRDDGDRRNLRHLIRYFNLPGAQELLDALDSPDPKDRKLPDCGCEPLHPAKTLPSRVNFDDLHYLLQVNQARALTLGVEWFRSRQPRCMGTLYWQLNDCWPGGTTWSCIDGDGKFKPLWYATRRFFADVTYTIQPQPDGSLALFVVNDSDEPRDEAINISRRDFDGQVLATQEARVNVAPRSISSIPIDAGVATPSDAARELIVAGSAMWYFAPDKDLHYPAAKFESDWSDGKLTIRARSLMRDLCVFADRLDPEATISDQLVTLLPGESFRFEIGARIEFTKEQLTTPPVLRCVNAFGRRI